MKKFLKCFVYAFRGIVFCLANERNMRVHLCFTVYMFGYLTVYDFFDVSRTGFAVLFTLCALVMSLEAVNTAVERAVDLAAKGEISPLAKVAKDSCAGAVLISAIAAVAPKLPSIWNGGCMSNRLGYVDDVNSLQRLSYAASPSHSLA